MKNLFNDYYKDEVKYIPPVKYVHNLNISRTDIFKYNWNTIYDFFAGKLSLFELFDKISKH